MPFPSPGELSDPGIKPRSPALRAGALPCEPPGKPQTKQETLLEKDTRAESSRVREPRRTALHRVQSQVFGDGVCFRVLASHFDSEAFLVAHIAQPRWMLAGGILEGDQTHDVSFRPFVNSSGW